MSETYAIGCPLEPDRSPSMVRTDGLDVSLRFENTTGVPHLLPRFLGKRCQFVPSATEAGQQHTDFDLWTTACPLNPGTKAGACFLRSENPGR